jgi:hypothetical protein
MSSLRGSRMFGKRSAHLARVVDRERRLRHAAELVRIAHLELRHPDVLDQVDPVRRVALCLDLDVAGVPTSTTS